MFPQLTWHVPVNEKIIYLTFDDGPIPVVTEFVLDTLQSFDAKATFFCVGDNIRKNPEVFKKVLSMGHAVGNHTFNHLKGWQTQDQAYVDNVRKCTQVMEETSGYTVRDQLFRPPYGRIGKKQIAELIKSHKIIMWDVLTCDYNKSLKPEDCLKKSIHYTKSGSIVVFHDSVKSIDRLRVVLPR
ncbi:MAG: polysaccharide deacetylase family protein, partial [Cytophagales bacterium]|nr:polysaccharide deacetylase family protein [Cytophagales bacterium]